MNVTQYVVPATGVGIHQLLTSLTSDVGTLLPIGVGLMALFLGVTVIPKIVYKFF